MRYLLDKLHTELVQVLGKQQQKSKKTIVSDIFGGVLQSDVSKGSSAWWNLLNLSICSLTGKWGNYQKGKAMHDETFYSLIFMLGMD